VSGSPTSSPTGTVTFLDGSTTLTTATIFQNGGAEVAPNIILSTPGSRTLVAQYSGDASNAPTTFNTPITVNDKATPTLTWLSGCAPPASITSRHFIQRLRTRIRLAVRPLDRANGHGHRHERRRGVGDQHDQSLFQQPNAVGILRNRKHHHCRIANAVLSVFGDASNTSGVLNVPIVVN